MTKEQFGLVLVEARQKGIEAVIGMEDNYPCGGAYLIADGNSEIVKLFKKFGEKDESSYPCYYNLAGWHARKA